MKKKLVNLTTIHPLMLKARYYQKIAIQRTLEAIAKGQKRILIVMATGTGKTFTAFQIILTLESKRS